jgi:hypothetical protein
MIRAGAIEALSNGYGPANARVPHPGAARGRGRPWHGAARRAEAARHPRHPAAQREPRRFGRATCGRPVCRRRARHRRHAGAAADLRAPQGPRLCVGDRDPLARLRPSSFRRPARPEPVRAPDGRGEPGAPRRLPASGRSASRGAAIVAWSSARRPRLRVVRPDCDRAARGAAARGDRAAARSRARPRSPPGAGGGARGTRSGSPAERRPPRAPDDRALPVGQAGRGARGLPQHAIGARRGVRDRARAGAPGARAGRSDAGSVAHAGASSSCPGGSRRRARSRRARGPGGGGSARCAPGARRGPGPAAGAGADHRSVARGRERARARGVGRQRAAQGDRRQRTDGGLYEPRPNSRRGSPGDDLRRRARAAGRPTRSRRDSAPGRSRGDPRSLTRRRCRPLRPRRSPCGHGVYVPFGGGDHDWAALELGAWVALSASVPLRLVGTKADPRRGQRDASRLLADASLAVQRVVGVEAEPLLAEPTEEALVAAVDGASLVVVGISPRWRQDGIGHARRALVRDARPATLLVHGGLRPGGLAPRESRTRFTWSIAA